MKKQFRKLKNNKSGFVGIIIAVVIVVAVIAGVVVVVVLRGGPFTLIGETNYTYNQLQISISH